MHAAAGQVFNVGSGHEITINALAEQVKKLAASRSPIVHVPYENAYQPGFEEPYRRVPDISKLYAAIGFVPKVDLDTSLRRVIAHHQR